MAKKETALMVQASETQLAELAQAFPQEASFTRIQVPRLGMLATDKTQTDKVNGKKVINVIASAGTFFIEKESDEEVTREDGTKGKEWTKDYLDEENPEVIIVFQRKQLRYYDNKEEKFTSSPIFDRDDEIVPLFKDRKKVASGTVAELKALYPGFTKAGKPTSLLKEEKILYVIKDGELFQMNIGGSHLWSFQSYCKKVAPPTVVTMLGSTEEVKGDNEWNKMSFEPVRLINMGEYELVKEKLAEIISAIQSEKDYFSSQNSEAAQVEKEMDAVVAQPEQKAF